MSTLPPDPAPPAPPAAADARLAHARAQIDSIDDAIHDLLMERAQVVANVAAAKGPSIAHETPVRIAREAQMLRRLAARHRGSLPFTAVADLWHELIAASTAIQAPFSVVVAGVAPGAKGGGPDQLAAFDLARQQFGSAIPIICVEDARSALRQVADGSAGVAVLPPPESGTPGARAVEAPWWTLLSAAADAPRIVCALPSVLAADPDEPVRRRYLADEGPNPARAVAVARAPFDPSGDDVTLMVATSPAFVSPDSCAAGFGRADISAWRLAVAEDPHGGPERDKGAGTAQLHLIALDGYVAGDDPRLKLLLKPAGGPFGDIWPVGGYPVPVRA